jgi:hypothetical protein
VKHCVECTDPIEPQERWTEAGLDFCKKYECMKKRGRRITGVAVVMAHKQGPMVVATADVVGQNFMDASGHLG